MSQTKIMTKRYFTAIEVEAMLQGAREKVGFVGVTEINSVRTMVETAKRNGRIGDKVLIVLPAVYIHVPSWQRRLDMNRSRVIGMNYNKHKWEVPKVIIDEEGKLICIDGMHRIIGAFIGNIEYIVVEVLTDISEKEAIELFLNQTKDRSRMNPCDYYYASLKAEKKEYILFKEICHKNNVQVKGDATLSNPIGTFTSVTDGVKLCKTNPELLDRILKLICNLQWSKNVAITEPDNSYNNKCFGAKYIRTMKKLYAYYADNASEMEKILLNKCKGNVWFTENASRPTQEALFDKLSKIIQAELTKETTILRAVI